MTLGFAKSEVFIPEGDMLSLRNTPVMPMRRNWDCQLAILVSSALSIQRQRRGPHTGWQSKGIWDSATQGAKEGYAQCVWRASYYFSTLCFEFVENGNNPFNAGHQMAQTLQQWSIKSLYQAKHHDQLRFCVRAKGIRGGQWKETVINSNYNHVTCYRNQDCKILQLGKLTSPSSGKKTNKETNNTLLS